MNKYMADDEISEHVKKHNRYEQSKQEIVDLIKSEFDKSNGLTFDRFYKNYKEVHLVKKPKRRFACYLCRKNIPGNSINIKTIVKNGIREVNFHDPCLDLLVYSSKNVA